jgi:RNA polymerase sigma factor (sigma-70 family)
MKNSCHSTCAYPDAELLNLMKNQDLIAFDVLYKRYWDPLLHFASQFLEDEDSCEEMVQELFVHLHKRHKSLNITTAIRPYLYTSLRNRIFNYVRSRAIYKRHIALACSEIVYISNDVEQFIDFVELNKKIALCLKQMPAKNREVYLLHFYEQYPLKKVAFMLKRPIDTVEKQLRRAKSILRNYLILSTKDA